MGIKKSKRKYILLLIMLIIIPFLGFFSYFLVHRSSPFPLIQSLFSEYTPKVKYETFKVYIDENIDQSVAEKIKDSVANLEFQNTKRFEFVDEKNAKYTLKFSEGLKKEAVSSRTLVPVGHIYWINGETSLLSLKGKEVLMESEEYEYAGEYISEKYDLKIKKVDSLSTELKKSENSIGFLFPSKLTHEFKVLVFDERDIFDGISLSYVLDGEENVSFVNSILRKNIEGFDMDTIDMEKVVKINMSGVTAMSRGLGIKIDASGNMAYAARDIGEFLADADLTHTSNEVSFMEGCNVLSGMRFCSKPGYIKTLEASGVDIVELTGNHNNDFGAENNTKSIQMYKDRGWEYFGGGLNKEDASKILYKEVKGSTIAFLGYNYYDSMGSGSAALAGDNRAGANSYSVKKLEDDIKEAKENADVVIVTFQFQECYSYPSSDVIYPVCYKPLSAPDQKGVFRRAVDFGADIVVGTQAHQPQTYEVYKDGVIFYGLGNIYFDQYRWIGTRQGLVLSIYILEGTIVQTRVTPTIYDRDLIPRVAEKEASDLLLNLLKSARNF
jgi:hypothetical protein